LSAQRALGRIPGSAVTGSIVDSSSHALPRVKTKTMERSSSTGALTRRGLPNSANEAVASSAVPKESQSAAHVAASSSELASFFSLASPGKHGTGTTPVRVSDEGLRELRQLVRSQQQRIDFLEHAHQQSLRQLQRSREDLATSQQQRFLEADKALKLEQLISELQAQPFFNSDPQRRHQWEDWLRRSRTALDSF